MTGVLRIVVATMLVAGAAFAHDSMDAGRPGRAVDVTRTVSVTADETGFGVKTNRGASGRDGAFRRHRHRQDRSRIFGGDPSRA